MLPAIKGTSMLRPKTKGSSKLLHWFTLPWLLYTVPHMHILYQNVTNAITHSHHVATWRGVLPKSFFAVTSTFSC